MFMTIEGAVADLAAPLSCLADGWADWLTREHPLDGHSLRSVQRVFVLYGGVRPAAPPGCRQLPPSLLANRHASGTIRHPLLMP